VNAAAAVAATALSPMAADWALRAGTPRMWGQPMAAAAHRTAVSQTSRA
jgi:hypothetical protein